MSNHQSTSEINIKFSHLFKKELIVFLGIVLTFLFSISTTRYRIGWQLYDRHILTNKSVAILLAFTIDSICIAVAGLITGFLLSYNRTQIKIRLFYCPGFYILIMSFVSIMLPPDGISVSAQVFRTLRHIEIIFSSYLGLSLGLRCFKPTQVSQENV